MAKRKLYSMMYTTSLVAIICFLASISFAQAPPASQFEVYCSAGSSPLAPNGWTFNPTTNKYRAWLCVDANGNVSIIAAGAGGNPGGNSGNVQVNVNPTTFGGVSGSTSDVSDGLIGLAPTGTGVALTVTSDAHNSDAEDLFDTQTDELFLLNVGTPDVFLRSGITGNDIDLNADAGSTFQGSAVAIRPPNTNYGVPALLIQSDGVEPILQMQNQGGTPVVQYDQNGKCIVGCPPYGQTIFNGPARVAGTVYQNTTGRPIFVQVIVSGGAQIGVSAQSDTSNPPTTFVAVSDGVFSSNGAVEIFFIVIPGNFYLVTASVGTIPANGWIEWN